MKYVTALKTILLGMLAVIGVPFVAPQDADAMAFVLSLAFFVGVAVAILEMGNASRDMGALILGSLPKKACVGIRAFLLTTTKVAVFAAALPVCLSAAAQSSGEQNSNGGDSLAGTVVAAGIILGILIVVAIKVVKWVLEVIDSVAHDVRDILDTTRDLFGMDRDVQSRDAGEGTPNPRHFLTESAPESELDERQERGEISNAELLHHVDLRFERIFALLRDIAEVFDKVLSTEVEKLRKMAKKVSIAIIVGSVLTIVFHIVNNVAN